MLLPALIVALVEYRKPLILKFFLGATLVSSLPSLIYTAFNLLFFNPVNQNQMKNLILTTLAFLFLMAAPTMAAETTVGEPLIVRSHIAEGGLEVIIANLEKETALVTLTSLQTDRELFSDRIRNHNGYSYNINLDDLHHGRYILSVKKGDVTRKQVILVNSKGVLCSQWK